MANSGRGGKREGSGRPEGSKQKVPYSERTETFIARVTSNEKKNLKEYLQKIRS